MTRPRVLHVARNYPNPMMPRLGLWTERIVRATRGSWDAEVIAPVPYWPPIPGPTNFTRYRRVPRELERDGVRVHHPRFPAGPGSSLKQVEAPGFYAAVRGVADRRHAEHPFSLIHGHFIDPDGWAAARLARRYGVPFIVTEHASWRPWLDHARYTRRRAVLTATQSRFLVAVSRSLAASITEFVDLGDRLRVIPNIVDDHTFPSQGDVTPIQNRLIFVGLIRRVKGLDILLRALRLLIDQGTDVTLTVVGESFYGAYRADHREVLSLVEALGLSRHVRFLGGMAPEDVAREIGRSRALVLPSRRETFGAVLVESLACGRPVVATRCGGPEDIVDDAVGVLVEPEDPGALAEGIIAVLGRHYDPAALTRHAMTRFGTAAVGTELSRLYAEALVAPATGTNR